MSDNEHLSERTDKIRQLNDRFRNGDMSLGKVVFTGELAQEAEDVRLAHYLAVRKFEAFNPGDDPYGEHDFGALKPYHRKIQFKIDYYDHSLEFGADDPADPANCRRILSIFYAEDY